MEMSNDQTIQLTVFDHFDFTSDVYEGLVREEFEDMPDVQQPDKPGAGRVVHGCWLLPAASHPPALVQAEGAKT